MIKQPSNCCSISNQGTVSSVSCLVCSEALWVLPHDCVTTCLSPHVEIPPMVIQSLQNLWPLVLRYLVIEGTESCHPT